MAFFFFYKTPSQNGKSLFSVVQFVKSFLVSKMEDTQIWSKEILKSICFIVF